ncbi:MAG: hypothetical protein D4R48_05755, partial [Nitrosomonadales bacterium]
NLKCWSVWTRFPTRSLTKRLSRDYKRHRQFKMELAMPFSFTPDSCRDAVQTEFLSAVNKSLQQK